MQLGEGVLAALTHHPEHDPKTCAFCHQPPKPTEELNDFTDKADEDADELAGLEVDGVAFKNCAAELGKKLIQEGWQQLAGTVRIPGIPQDLPVQSAAHHVIPGNATLKESELKPYLHVEGKATGNIGYDVNNHENGVWLAGNYALRGKDGLPKWGPQGSGFTAKYARDPREYAFAAIEELRCQFHDAHANYSDFVLRELNLLAQKLEETKDLWCPEAKDQGDDPEKRQMFMLVARLNTISRRLKRFLTSPGPGWRTNVYTSRFSEAYIKKIHG